MDKNEQYYCVVATRRIDKYNRVMITGPMLENQAYSTSAKMQKIAGIKNATNISKWQSTHLKK